MKRAVFASILLGWLFLAGAAFAAPANETPPGRTEQRGHGNDEPTTAPGRVSHANARAARTASPPGAEPGGSGVQGSSMSEPDNNGSGPERDEGCIDKPASMGGTCTDGDQDGNNGCGNDVDRDDDNEGWCGRAQASGEITAASIQAAGFQAAGVEVLGRRFARAPVEAAGVGGAVGSTILARTGVPAVSLVIAGVVSLALAGLLGVRLTRLS
jgi:hypothetical protein